ncbi:AIDA-I autotransporter precursor [compost metagenome]
MSVSNINGAGAQTVNGIRLVQVGGASNGTFALQGRAVGGMYEYFLRKGTPAAANGN